MLTLDVSYSIIFQKVELFIKILKFLFNEYAGFNNSKLKILVEILVVRWRGCRATGCRVSLQP